MGKSFVIAMKEHLKLESESNMDFLREIKTLNDDDRKAFHKLMLESGIECDAPLPITSAA